MTDRDCEPHQQPRHEPRHEPEQECGYEDPTAGNLEQALDSLEQTVFGHRKDQIRTDDEDDPPQEDLQDHDAAEQATPRYGPGAEPP